MDAKFQIEGVITDSYVKNAKTSDREYAQVKVACGTSEQEFFVQVADQRAGKYPVGAQVSIEGNIGKNGYNPELQPTAILVADDAKVA